VPQWLDDVAAEVFVDDGSVDVGDLRSFGEPVDHDGVKALGQESSPISGTAGNRLR
jgi:hypothetical protein